MGNKKRGYVLLSSLLPTKCNLIHDAKSKVTRHWMCWKSEAMRQNLEECWDQPYASFEYTQKIVTM